jgi:transposase
MGHYAIVSQSDQRRAPGHLSRQGPPALRWALFKAAQVARRPGSPDRDYSQHAAERLGTAAGSRHAPCRHP